VHGLILVGAYISDLGDSNEAASGYFSGEKRGESWQVRCGLFIGGVRVSDPDRHWIRIFGVTRSAFKMQIRFYLLCLFIELKF
jgi:hypothetical protein